ncbi:molybdenum cofactor biosynthesis protein MoeA [Flavobacterium akiainvivens]|uniref:GTP 3',8-cyclase n=1 Tax=Flavobacterium akiainvivens TaxID=1202724 RepID=A0A0M9VH32_9FLAO|nr:GTP 3',8-cyclase MoaA [Flavobacterium akiainvivens]KOS05126.1 molybdenum cofactor biosynthesis protein MoeA [Flavobacterium akiainvivens]SFQ51383.1 cyclic pyranopterin monophosphate synthase subunit MoaA [Flavobacterium akiainvivens]
MITDTFGRVHNYLRISLTDNCNLRCFYCMPEEKYAFAPASKLMQVHEIEQLAKLFVANGVTKIRLTGGEPLVRKDAPKIIEALGKLGVELAITTNGVRLHEMLPELIAANISTINISLDTLQPDKFLKITRRDLYHRVRSNIELLLQHNIRTKINVVVMKGLNDNEINDFIALTKHYPLEIRFIEFMPFSGNKWTSNQVVTLQEVLDTVAQKYEALPVEGNPHDTAKHYMIPGHAGSFAVISTMSAPFCEGCNRMRLTADGKLKNCLFSKSETDLLGALRAGDEVLPLIHNTIKAKAKALGGQMDEKFENLDAAALQNRSMITIGG